MVDGDDFAFYRTIYSRKQMLHETLDDLTRHDKLLILHFSISCERGYHIFIIFRVKYTKEGTMYHLRKNQEKKWYRAIFVKNTNINILECRKKKINLLQTIFVYF